MKIELKYDIGDEVFALDYKNVAERPTCDVCEGGHFGELEDERDRNITYTAVVLNGQKFVCPKCDGKGTLYRSDMKYVVEPVTLTSARVSVRHRDCHEAPYYNDKYWEAALHPTLEAAQARLFEIGHSGHA
jgi:hypothetical protein